MVWAEVEVNLRLRSDQALSLKDMNRMFYESYPRGHFKSLLMLLLAAYHDPAGALGPLASETIVKGEEGEAALQVQGTVEPDEEQTIRQAARLQMAALYYHCLETFVRLFLAHAPDVNCPWMQLVRDEGPPFVNKVKQIEAFSPTWESREKPEDEHIRLAFFPVASPNKELREAFGHAKSWLRFAAQESRRARINNAFKHGVSVRAGEPGLALYTGTDPRSEPNAQPLLRWSGEALVTLARVRQPDKSWSWVMENRKLTLNESVGVIFLVQRWIQALLDVGEMRFVKHRPGQHVDVPNVSYETFVEKARLDKEPTWSIRSFAMPTGWADRQSPKGKGARRGKAGRRN